MSDGCGYVDLLDTSKPAAWHVLASGTKYNSDATSDAYGSNPGTLEYGQLKYADGNWKTQCEGIAKQVLKDRPSLAASYCYNQTDGAGFGFESGQFLATCTGDACPLPGMKWNGTEVVPNICYAATCTVWGSILDGASKGTIAALGNFSMDTGASTANTLALAPDVASTIASVAVAFAAEGV
jgi:hypothetical protein